MHFLHRIGKSTVNQGITVPADCQEQWMLDICKGQCVSVTLSFSDEEFKVDLRRINNLQGHLQFRYERQEHQRLKDHFLQLVGRAQSKNGCVVEIVESKRGVFKINPIAGVEDNRTNLSIYRPICHLLEQREVSTSPEFREIVNVVSTIDFVPDGSQRVYNECIRQGLRKKNWLVEERVHDAIGLKCDFRKEGIWLEVEFGNARSYYQDYIKFLIAAKYRDYQYGVLLCPTCSFANYLCDLGSQRARQKSNRVRNASYSGMMTYEKAIRELPYLQHILNEKVVIAGLDVSSERLAGARQTKRA